MRHLSTLIAAVFIAPLSWVLLAYGQDRSTQEFANVAHGDFIRPAVCLAGAGLLLGLLATLRFSPLGVVVAGAGYAASYLALLAAPERVLDMFPEGPSSVDLTIPLRTGTSLLLGALMLVAMTSVARWRAWPSTEASTEPAAPAEKSPETMPEDRPLGADELREPEYAMRHASSPRSYAPLEHEDAGAWATQQRTTWPFT